MTGNRGQFGSVSATRKEQHVASALLGIAVQQHEPAAAAKASAEGFALAAVGKNHSTRQELQEPPTHGRPVGYGHGLPDPIGGSRLQEHNPLPEACSDVATEADLSPRCRGRGRATSSQQTCSCGGIVVTSVESF